MAKKKEQIIEIKPIRIDQMKVTIEGITDLVLNKMNDVTKRELTDIRKNKAKDKREVNVWEQVITSVAWEKGNPKTDPDEWTEETMQEMLSTNRPCISSFGLMKSFGDAVVRNEIDTYATKFKACVNVVADNNLVPVDAVDWYMDEKLMSPKRGAPVLVRLNRFSHWRASFTVQFIEGGSYSREQIINIINLAGFGLGIGSGRSSGYGRYHVVDAE